MKQHLAALALAAAFAQPATGATAQDNRLALGEVMFFSCHACHFVGDQKLEKIGPHLNDLFGRKPGSLPDYEYSDAMVAVGQDKVWDEATLTTFLYDPQAAVPDTTMKLSGIKSDDQLQALLVYLATFDPDGMAPK